MDRKPEKDLKAQGERFKQVREYYRYGTQAEFGEALGKLVNKDEGPIDFSTIAKYERGDLEVSKKVKLVLFSRFKVDMDWFEVGKGDMIVTGEVSNDDKPASFVIDSAVHEVEIAYLNAKEFDKGKITKERLAALNEAKKSLENLKNILKNAKKDKK